MTDLTEAVAMLRDTTGSAYPTVLTPKQATALYSALPQELLVEAEEPFDLLEVGTEVRVIGRRGTGHVTKVTGILNVFYKTELGGLSFRDDHLERTEPLLAVGDKVEFVGKDAHLSGLTGEVRRINDPRDFDRNVQVKIDSNTRFWADASDLKKVQL